MNDDDFAELFKTLPGGQSSASWRDTAAEPGTLGKTFKELLQQAWQSQDADASLSPLRDMLASAIQQLNRTVDGTPEATAARDQLGQLSESIRTAVARSSAEL